MKLTFDLNSQSFPIDLTPSGKSYRATVGDKTVEIELLQAKDGKLDLLIDGERVTAYVSSDQRQTLGDGQRPDLRVEQIQRAGAKAEGDTTMPQAS